MSKKEYTIGALCGGRLWLCLLLPLFTACGDFPADPKNSFNRAKNDTLHVGIMENKPFTIKEGETYRGIEAEMVKAFAKHINAELKWTAQTEEQLFKKLENFELDLVIGGITDKTPRKKQAALTRPYKEITNNKLVIAVAPGENKLLLQLEKFIEQYNADQ